jgi:hypothetical protein
MLSVSISVVRLGANALFEDADAGDGQIEDFQGSFEEFQKTVVVG